MNFLTGTTPVRTDSKWKLWFKFAKAVQAGSESNAPLYKNSKYQLKVKVLKSLDGI